MADVSPEGANGGGVTCWASRGSGRYKSGDTGVHRPLLQEQANKSVEKKRQEEFEELELRKVVPPLSPKRTPSPEIT